MEGEEEEEVEEAAPLEGEVEHFHLVLPLELQHLEEGEEVQMQP